MAANSNGVYSLYNGWLKVPVKDDIPEGIDLEPELTEFINRSKECNTLDTIESFIDDIYKLRQESIINDGEYGKGNLIFKEIRNRGILQELKDLKVKLENDEMSLNEKIDYSYSPELEEKLFNKYINQPLSKSDLDNIWDDIMEEYGNPELAEEVCASLEIYLDDMYGEALSSDKLDEEVDPVKLLNEKRDSCIKEYRHWAGLSDDDIITEDNLNDWALTRVSCNENYDYDDLKEVLLGCNK